MRETGPKTLGLGSGLIILAIMACLGFVSAFNAEQFATQIETQPETEKTELADRLTDISTQNYLTQLKRYAPVTAERLEREADTRIRTGVTDQTLSELVLLSILMELKDGAAAFRRAPPSHYNRLIDHARQGLTRLQRENSPWCEGPQLLTYLEQDDDELIPSLIALYPYESESYNWAMEFGVLALDAIQAGRHAPINRTRPSNFDKALLQDAAITLGADQPTIALQVMAFSASEGTGYRPMKTAVQNIQACRLGLFALQTSDRLPEVVRVRVWSDLLPELFYGNTPYVIWRVNDYFYR
ncbi:MAG: hypothetical protein AAGG45_09220 [Pseudomonadota bacterium]